MKEIRFKATDKMVRYNGIVSFADGEVRAVEDAEADRLLTTYPDNFTAVKVEVKSHRPKKNKMHRADRDK